MTIIQITANQNGVYGLDVDSKLYIYNRVTQEWELA